MNTKQYQDALKYFYKELTDYIVDPSLGYKKLNFEITGFSKGPGNVVIVNGKLTVKQSTTLNMIDVKDVLRSESIKYFNAEKSPKTL